MKKINHIPFFGEHSNDVVMIQTDLNNNGYNPGIVDGIYGSATRNAISDFQEANNLVDDGILGPKTLNALGYEVKTIMRDGFAALSWEKQHSERKEWTDVVYKTIISLWAKLQQCTDITNLRPDFDSLTVKQQQSIWAELVCAICLHESGWKATSWMVETTMNIDLVTGKQVKSEGLMQLSYQDKSSYSKLLCGFDWNLDKDLDQNDPNKTIFNPQFNLEFGIEILANQIVNYKTIALTNKGLYWAVLNTNGKYSKLLEISKMLRGINF